MRTFIRAALASVIALAFVVGPVSAATTQAIQVAQAGQTGTVTGQVTADSGGNVSGASVLIQGAGQRQSTTTDDSGNFSLSVPPGLYTITIVKGGFQTASDDVTVAPDSTITANVTLTTASLQTLNVIGRTSSTGTGNAAKFNITSSQIATLNQQQITERQTPDLTEEVNELPGVTIVHATSNVNQDFVLRGLRYETKVTLDGHPVSGGTAGTFLTNYTNAAIFGGVDVVTGGAPNGPLSAEAGAGIVNLHTPNFTSNNTGYLMGGIDQYGGSQYAALADINLMNDKLSFIFGRTFSGYRGPTFGQQEVDYAGASVPTTGTYSAPPLSNGIVQYINDFSDTYGLNAELAKMRYQFSDATSLSFEFLGLQGGFNPQGGAYGQYLGQFTVPQCINKNVAGSGAACTDLSEYNSPNGQQLIGSTVPGYVFYPGSFVEQNQPNFNAEFKTTLGNDTILFRPYTAAINRLIDGTQENNVPGDDSSAGGWYQVTNVANCQPAFVAVSAGNGGAKGPCFQGTGTPIAAYVGGAANAVPVTFATTNTAPTCSAATPCYTTPTAINNSGQYGYGSPYTTLEVDHLAGYTFSYVHPVGANSYNLSFDHYFDDTTAYINDASPLAPGCSFTYTGGNNPGPGGLGDQPNCSIGVTAAAPFGVLRATPVSVPETFASVSSLSATASLAITSKLEMDLGAFFTHYVIDAQEENPAVLLQYATPGAPLPGNVATTQGIAPIDFIPSFNSASHFDPRFGLVFRPNRDWVMRFSAGSAMTIPYASLVSGSLSYAQSVASTTESTPNYGLLPEETVTLDAGSDYRMPDGTVLSADIYNLVVHNPWMSSKVIVCANVAGCPPNGLEGTTFYQSATFNGAQQYAQGIDFSLTNEPAVGFGYRVNASFERNYYLDTPASFFQSAEIYYNGAQLISNGSGVTSVPYAKGYAETQYALANGGLFRIGAEYEGNNNSYNAPAFWVFDAGAKVNTGFHNVMFNVGVENLTSLNFGAMLAKGVEYQGIAPIAGTATATGYAYSTPFYSSLVAPPPFTVRFSLSKTFP